MTGLLRVLPNNSLHLLPFEADQYKPEVHNTQLRCQASNPAGTIISTAVHVKAGKTLQVSFVLFTVLHSGIFVGYSIPQTFTVYQTLAISLLAMFFDKYFTGLLLIIFWHIFLNSKDIFLAYYQLYWINSGVYTLVFKPFLPGLHDWKTVFGSWGIFNSILCHVICNVSSVKYWECSNITIARGGQF